MNCVYSLFLFYPFPYVSLYLSFSLFPSMCLPTGCLHYLLCIFPSTPRHENEPKERVIVCNQWNITLQTPFNCPDMTSANTSLAYKSASEAKFQCLAALILRIGAYSVERVRITGVAIINPVPLHTHTYAHTHTHAHAQVWVHLCGYVCVSLYYYYVHAVNANWSTTAKLRTSSRVSQMKQIAAL